MEKLFDILRLRRAHGSNGEAEFIKRYLVPLAPEIMCNPSGEVLAYVIDRSHPNYKTQVMWSCHIDTMHDSKVPDLEQDIWATEDGVVFVTEDSDCLGADDGAGAWLMLEMLAAGVEGTYVFHRGEEIGCWGSRQMALDHKEFISRFTHAIAFDRRGKSSIITHQRGQRACSDALGSKLIALLDYKQDMEHELDPTGIYTDTAEYMDIVPECVNISVGYSDEHSNLEALDTEYLGKLRDAVCTIDWMNAGLPVERDPTKIEYRDDYGWGIGSTSKAYKRSSGSALDPRYVPTLKELFAVNTWDIMDWAGAAETEDIAYLISDMLDEIASMKYELEHADDDDHVDGDDYDNLRLKAGLQ